MAIISSKWMVAALVLTSILLILFLIGKKSVHAEVIIKASSEKVWMVLTDISKIKEWNKVLVPVEGKIAEGQTLKYEFYQEENSKATVMKANVIKLVPAKLLNQKGGIPGILTFNHKYLLEEKNGDTKVQVLEEYRGIMVPFWDPKPVEEAYMRLLNSLKKRVIEL